MVKIVFLTLYLGLVTGKQPVSLQADSAVKSVRVAIDGTTVATLTAPPWRTEVDFWRELLPHEIVAIGYNVNHKEIARASQFVNVPRADAELEVALARDAEGRARRATLVGHHVAEVAPRSATLKLDGKALAVGKDFSAALPAADMKRPHLLSAEMHFADGTVAQREVVFGGEFAESAEAQLTPLAVVRTGASDDLPADGCFVANGVPLRVRSIEQGTAQVIVVRDPVPATNQALRRGTHISETAVPLDEGTYARVLSPVAEHIAKEQTATTLFPLTPPLEGWKIGMLALLTSGKSGRITPGRFWADAAAVAGVHAAADGRRRAVIVVLGLGFGDRSNYKPAAVRKYLEALGVPLFVWSTTGPRPDDEAEWGPIADVTSGAKLSANVDRVRAALDAQRVAWIEADPVTALRAQIKDGCGYKRAAHP